MEGGKGGEDGGKRKKNPKAPIIHAAVVTPRHRPEYFAAKN